ncbi:Uncharacterized protein TCM_012920 [Theobroma cacao]|uniref:Uncharacterized protein n=1 Tax=Theobroma cacao TaxID=3641 RepID=A0A061FV39_THECC|nr:Uncharacterized protein TCM_012920 [Theobroma cacao]
MLMWYLFILIDVDGIDEIRRQNDELVYVFYLELGSEIPVCSTSKCPSLVKRTVWCIEDKSALAAPLGRKGKALPSPANVTSFGNPFSNYTS